MKNTLLLSFCLVALSMGCNKTDQKAPAENHNHQGHNHKDNKLDLSDNASNNAIQPRVEFDIKTLLARQKNINESFPNSSNLLAFDLYKKLAHENNLAFSPLSISSALAMAYVGSKDETQNSFKSVLHYGDNTRQFHKNYGEFTLLLANKDRSAHDTTVEIANTLWLQKDFNVLENFKNTLGSAYKAQPMELDFKGDAGHATDTINQTISKQTHGEIANLLKGPLPPDTHLVLTNAMFFKSLWLSAFKSENTDEGDFKLADGTVAKAKLMKQENNFLYGEDADKQFLLLPYKDEEFATLFVLPAEGKFSDVEAGLSEVSFKSMLKNLSDTKVSLWLPKFAQRTTPNVKKVLKDLGLGIAFDQQQANFSGISNKTNFYIEDIAHEAVVKMFEEGTKAAAATGVIFAPTSIAEPIEPEKLIEFHAERPFFFFIVHQPSSTILFMGHVNEPKDDL